LPASVLTLAKAIMLTNNIEINFFMLFPFVYQ